MKCSPSLLTCIIAALAGSAVWLSVPLLLAFKGIFSDPLRLHDDSPDDGFTHLVLLMLVAWPFVYLALATFNTLFFITLSRLEYFKKVSLIGIATGFALAALLMLGLDAIATMVIATSFMAGSALS
jgi:hypothetical protein